METSQNRNTEQTIIALLAALLILTTFSLKAHEADSARIPQSRKVLILNSLIAAGYTGTMTALNYAWYNEYERSSFHWFNDSKEWLQMDKAGHVFSSYYVSKIVSESYRVAGTKDRKSALIGSSLGFFFMSSVEVFDGFSAKWGASGSDLISNAAGAGLYLGQELLLKEQIISVKYSFYRSHYADIRPNTLGQNIAHSSIKDYNGITFWLSGSPFAKSTNEKLPKWLCLSIGYGAEGMIGGTINPDHLDGSPIAPYTRYRQLYFSLDVDFTKINTRSQVLRGVFKCINWVKIPLPTMEISRNKLHFHGLYF